MEPFFADFEADCAAAGQQISARTMMSRMAESAAPREAMLVAIERIRANGLGVAALTNNWAREDRAATEDGTRALRDLFDVFVESSVEGLRKPDPRIYELACERLAVTPPEAVFLDDIGRNLKPARALGMVTIKVDDPATALADLERVVGFALGD